MKVLIISHTAFNTHNNMGKTLLSLFSFLKKEELCHFYVYPMLPDVDKCQSHYRITDKDVLKSYFKFKVRGKEITSADIDTQNHTLFEDSNDEKLYRNKKNKTVLRVLLRDLMWKFSRWHTKELDAWIIEQKPTCIFVAPGMPKFLYDIAIKVSKKFSLPMIVYICDDFYFTIDEQKNPSFLKKVQGILLKKKNKKLFKNAQHIVTICDELAECYSNEFSLPATTVMTGSSYAPAELPKDLEKISKFTYMGNIRYNRYLCLAEIGKTLDEINQKEGTDCKLLIYSSEKDEEILSAFDGINSIEFCGFVSGEEFDKAFASSEVFIHTEAFDEVNINLTKRSVSTKIADCLNSGIPMFAYGPANIASMGHLIRNNAAVCATAKEELYEKLLICIKDAQARRTVALNGLETAKSCHMADKQSQKLETIFNGVLR